MKRDEFLQVLKVVVKMVEEMSDEDFRAFKRGQLRWIGPEKKIKLEQKTGAEMVDYSKVIATLNEFNDESEALSYLASCPEAKTNAQLWQLGRVLGANVKKNMVKGELQQAIVRYCVGRRLQSETISRVTRHR